MRNIPFEIDLLIFDLDGTLVDTLDDLTAAVNFTLAQFKLPPRTRPEVEIFIGHGVRKLLERALDNPPPEKLDLALGYFKQHYGANVCVHSFVYPGVREVLDRFAQKRKAILTNKPEEFTRPLVEKLGIAPHFEIILGGGDHLAPKPDPDGIRKILAQTGAAPAKTVIIGDSDTDILAGKAAGIITCAVTYGFRRREFLRPLEPDFMVNDLTEIKALLG